MPTENPPIDLPRHLIDLATYRTPERSIGSTDPLFVLPAYAQEELIYDETGHMRRVGVAEYASIKHSKELSIRNRLVNKFGLAYAPESPIYLHQRLADVIIDVSMEMFKEHGLITVVMDGLRTYDAGLKMQQQRPDLVSSGMLAAAGTSAHNRALAVDSKLFRTSTPGIVTLESLIEADEHGHLDDEQPMSVNSRFYSGPMSPEARKNRQLRLQAWQRASVKRRTPIANLLAEFWDDRVPGSPADMWRVLVCRAMCIGKEANPATTPAVAILRDALSEHHRAHEAGSTTRAEFLEAAHETFVSAWSRFFTTSECTQLDAVLGKGGGRVPEPQDYIFHEWLQTITDDQLESAGFRRQCKSL